MSNTERQRLFRERHPGYYADRQARRRQFAKASAHALVKRLQAEHAARVAAEAAAVAAVKPVLMLPAPAETLRIPGANAIPTQAEFDAMRVKEAA